MRRTSLFDASGVVHTLVRRRRGTLAIGEGGGARFEIDLAVET